MVLFLIILELNLVLHAKLVITVLVECTLFPALLDTFVLEVLHWIGIVVLKAHMEVVKVLNPPPSADPVRVDITALGLLKLNPLICAHQAISVLVVLM